MTTNRQFAMWGLGAFAATIGLATVLTLESRSPVRRHALYVVGVPERGAELFFGEKGCSGCHSINGRGGRKASDLGTIHPARPALASLAAAIWNHAPAMWEQMGTQPPPRLDQEEMAHLLAFLYQASVADEPGDPRAGQAVFSTKGCIQCHSVRGAGGNAAPELSKVGAGDAVVWVGAMWTHAQKMMLPITRKLGAWPEFQGEEMSHLIAYVNEGRPPLPDNPAGPTALHGSAAHGWSIFQAKCISCHAVGGKGGRVGPALGPELDLPHNTAHFAAILWNHAPQMLARVRQSSVTLPALRGDEIRDVLTFLMSLEYFEPSGSPLLGERAFRERGCGRCHGANGEGTPDGPRLKPLQDAYTVTSLASSIWNHGPGMAARARKLGVAWPTLEATDLGDVTSFLNETASTN